MIKRLCSIGLIPLALLLSACGGGGGQTSSTETSGTTDSGTVAVAPAGTIRLNWLPPTSRSDGDALSLSELESYTVYFGTSIGDYPYSVSIDDPSATSVDIPDLPAGTYYLVMTVTDRNGLESGQSGAAIKEVI